MWYFDICIHFEMITIIKLTYPSPPKVIIYLHVVKTLEIDCLCKFQVYNTVLSTMVTMLYIRSPELWCSGNFYLFLHIMWIWVMESSLWAWTAAYGNLHPLLYGQERPTRRNRLWSPSITISINHSFVHQVLSNCYVPNTILDTGDMMVNWTE